MSASPNASTWVDAPVPAQSRRNKVFLIGFNKCGTSSFHWLLGRSGLRSVHHGGNHIRTNIALALHRNFSLGRPLLTGIEQFDAFTDMAYVDSHVYVEGCRHFRDLHREFPDAYFVLNTRGVDSWLRSRFAHDNGSLVKRSLSIYGCTPDELRALWHGQFTRHCAEVEQYFSTRGRFLRFDIERDRPALLRDFMAEDWTINVRAWPHGHKTPEAHFKNPFLADAGTPESNPDATHPGPT